MLYFKNYVYFAVYRYSIPNSHKMVISVTVSRHYTEGLLFTLKTNNKLK